MNNSRVTKITNFVLVPITKGFTFKTTIKGITDPCWAIVETGSAINLIDLAHLVHYYPAALKNMETPSLAHYNTINGSKLIAIGYTTLQLDTGNSEFTVEFTVVIDMVQKMILGMPFLDQSHANINLANHKLLGNVL